MVSRQGLFSQSYVVTRLVVRAPSPVFAVSCEEWIETEEITARHPGLSGRGEGRMWSSHLIALEPAPITNPLPSTINVRIDAVKLLRQARAGHNGLAYPIFSPQ